MGGKRCAAVVLLGLGVMLVAIGVLRSGSADPAVRPPTVEEYEAIVRTLPASLRSVPVGCAQLDIRLQSTESGAIFARVEPRFVDASGARGSCVRYASNGASYLSRGTDTDRWEIVFEGSDLPSCELGIPRSLSECTR